MSALSYLGWKIDFANPPGEPALLSPASVAWRVYKNQIALAVGGVAAVLMEFAEPRIRSGVWDHSVFKTDPIGRSRRTAVAAMVGVYGPASAARRVIQGVTNMHARVAGETPGGATYTALDPELLDWVAATAGYGFLTAYDRFVAPLSAAEKAQFWAEGDAVAQLYGVATQPASEEAFLAMAARMSPRFEPHLIVDEFLAVILSSKAAPGTPRRLKLAFARAAVSVVPPLIRETLALGPAWNLTPLDRLTVRLAARTAERVIDRRAPPCQAALRLGLPHDFLWRSPPEQARLLATAGLAAAA